MGPNVIAPNTAPRDHATAQFSPALPLRSRNPRPQTPHPRQCGCVASFAKRHPAATTIAPPPHRTEAALSKVPRTAGNPRTIRATVRTLGDAKSRATESRPGHAKRAREMREQYRREFANITRSTGRESAPGLMAGRVRLRERAPSLGLGSRSMGANGEVGSRRRAHVLTRTWFCGDGEHDLPLRPRTWARGWMGRPGG